MQENPVIARIPSADQGYAIATGERRIYSYVLLAWLSHSDSKPFDRQKQSLGLPAGMITLFQFNGRIRASCFVEVMITALSPIGIAPSR